MKRLLSLIITLCLIITLMISPTIVSAEDTASGACSETVFWALDENGTLTISGSGSVPSPQGNWENWGITDNAKVKKLILGKDLTYTDFDNYSFPNLESIEVDKQNPVYRTDGYAFYKLIDGENVMVSMPVNYAGNYLVPDVIDQIDDSTFMARENLRIVTIPGTVKSIGACAFYYCYGLEEVVFLGSLKRIPEYMFAYCTSLATITLPKSVTTISYSAFKECTSLQTIDIPSSVVSIEHDAFTGSGISEIRFSGKAPLFDENCFSGITATVYYPSGDSTWTEEVLQNYGGNITWKIITPPLPKAVTNMRAYSAGKNRVTLRWDPSYDADGYLIYGQKNGKYGYVGMTTRGKSTFTDTMALENDYNFYWIFPFVQDKLGKMYLGPCPRYVFAKGIRPEVTNLSAVSSGPMSVTLTWDKVDGVMGYLIYAQKDGKYGYVAMTSETHYKDSYALDKDYNYYWVFPYSLDASGEICPGTCSKYVYAKGICPPVENLKAYSSKGGVGLSWKLDNAGGYLIYGIVDGKPYGYIGMELMGSSFFDRSPTTTQYNYYWVFAFHYDRQGNIIPGQPAKYVYGRKLE